jgi:DNA-binding GntR family transcriptional regulator
MNAAASENVDPYTLLREMILREHVLPNERLIETEYASRFGTSRGNIRKALARLEQDGLVVIEPFKGAHVRRITDVEAVEITEVRAALEALLVRHAAQRAEESDKEELRRLLSEARTVLATQNALDVGGATRQLREAIWRISGHSTGQRILTTINSQLVRIWFHAILMAGRPKEIVEDLEQVVEAICVNDADRASETMRRYHEGSIEALKLAVSLSGAKRDTQWLPEFTSERRRS